MFQLNDSEEIYSFENEDEIKKAIETDKIGEVILDYKYKSITYKMNRIKCIRLSDFIFWIQSDFIRIHLGQLLCLIFDLIKKVQSIESQGIEHYYLDLNRIWLQLQENSYPSIIYQFLYYHIHFTGYQCPFYEKKDSSLPIKASIKIKEIIQIIINRCFNRVHLKWTDPHKREELYNATIKPIMDLCKQNSSSTFQIFAQIQETLKQYKYEDDKKNNSVQTLETDDKINDFIGSQREKAISKVKTDLNNLIEFGSQYGQIVIDFLLQQQIPIISKLLESYSKVKLEYFIQAQQLGNNLQKREIKIKEILKQKVQILIPESLKKYDEYFKFEITKQEIGTLEQEIITSVLKSQQVQYFNNTYWLHSNNQHIDDFIFAAIPKIINQYVDDKLEELFTYKILLLIDELI
ncbi:unnamed protein product [Paramecium sonneborni]|uniref:Uncharacterized protein n=1 Tax=Paramecium sonneborni TaxID=65129 RepID=A0A8S1PEH5_9CILI|nr:unnamed protein product [Paramecium sonneborni]